MQLRSIHLKNYRKYRSQSIDFPSGIIGIVGKNGSGKSTLIEAVGWCLYGNTAARTKGEEIKTTGVAGEDCSVTLEFVLNSDAVRVVRELKGKNASVRASIFLNGDTIAHVRGAKEVSDYIAKRTGMDRVAFFASVFAQQKELNAFSELQPGDRKKTVMRLLRIDRIDEALSEIKKDIRGSAEKIQMLEDNLKDMNELIAKQKQATREKKQTDAQISKHDKTISDAATAEKKAKADFSVYERRYRKHNAIRHKLTGIVEKARSREKEKKTIETDQRSAQASKKQLMDMQPQLAEYKAIKQQKEDLDIAHGQFKEKKELERQHASLASEIRKVTRSNELIKNSLSGLQNLEAKTARQEAALQDKTAHIADLTVQISDISAEIKEAKRQKREYSENLDRMKKQGRDGTCPTCKRPLQDYLSLVSKQFADNISRLDKKICADQCKKERFESRLQLARDFERRISKRVKRTEDLMHKKTRLLDKLENDEKRLESLKEEESKLAMRLDSHPGLVYDRTLHRAVTTKHNKLQLVKDKSIGLSESVKRIPVLDKRHTQCLEAISTLKKKRETEEKNISMVGYDRTEHQKAKQASEKATAKLTDARVKAVQLESKAQDVARQLAQITEDISEETKKRAKIDEEKEKMELRSKLDRVMGNFRLDLISRIRPMLSQRASELLDKITRGRYAMIELDDDYNIRVEDNGESFTTDRFSGGEEDLANLCLRIAISQELSERSGWVQANFIALDEIFGSQDEERKRNILDALQTLSDQFRQILVITHIEDVKEALPYVLNVQEGARGTSGITVEGAMPSAA